MEHLLSRALHESPISEVEYVQNLLPIIETLPLREKKVLKMRFAIAPETKSHSYAEMADFWKIPVPRIGSVTQKALRRLRQRIDKATAA